MSDRNADEKRTCNLVWDVKTPGLDHRPRADWDSNEQWWHMEGKFGKLVRARRTSLNQTLKGLADASGVSVSMLSQVERGEREPTLPIAVRIAEGLGTHLSDLLDEPGNQSIGLLRFADASGTVDPVTGVRRLHLSRHLPPSIIEVTWYRVPAGVTVGPFIHRDAGLLEQVTVVAGRVRVTVGRETHDMRVGDTLAYRGAVKHRFENVGRTEASYIHLAHPSPVRISAGIR